MTLALAPDLRCEGCGAGVEPTEEGRCAFCRMEDRGDDQLLTHDSRGWIGSVEAVRHHRRGNGSDLAPAQSWTERIECRVPCGCGCGMVSVPEPVEPEHRAPTIIPGIPGGRPGPVSPWGREEIIAAMQAWAEHYGGPPSSAVWQKNAEDHPGYARVGAVFGSWSAGLEAAGFDGRRRAAGAWQAKAISGTAHAVGSGENAHAWADALGVVDGVEVRFRHEIEPHSQKLLASLGATYVIDAGAPACEGPCGDSACAPAAPPASRLSSLDSSLLRLAEELER